jgi:hypothetical protein
VPVQVPVTEDFIHLGQHQDDARILEVGFAAVVVFQDLERMHALPTDQGRKVPVLPGQTKQLLGIGAGGFSNHANRLEAMVKGRGLQVMEERQDCFGPVRHKPGNGLHFTGPRMGDFEVIIQAGFSHIEGYGKGRRGVNFKRKRFRRHGWAPFYWMSCVVTSNLNSSGAHHSNGKLAISISNGRASADMSFACANPAPVTLRSCPSRPAASPSFTG